MDADADAGTTGPGRKRISLACEACRATKVRCRPSECPDVCQKCLASKRECISRNGPRRPRRSKKAEILHNGDPSFSLPPGPSSTFSIDFAVPARAEPEDSLDTLRESHMQSLDQLFPDADEDLFPSQTVSPGTASLPTPSSSSTQSQPQSIHDLSGKPLFNLASAESLLRSFRYDKLRHFPCIVLPDDASVPVLAATQPFVLLAILAASSGSKKLQGHALYDQEFRKVLSLKFVASGERTLELLQGILIYIAWYPFHLRPKERHGLQYMKMASELIDDLELARELPLDLDTHIMSLDKQQIDGIRAYLSYVYVTTTHTVSWKSKSGVINHFTAWTSTYCDILDKLAQHQGDAILTALCRNSCALNEAYTATHEDSNQLENNRRLLLYGLGTKLSEFRATLVPGIASSVSFRLQSLFLDVYIDCGPLLRLPTTAQLRRQSSVLPLESSRLHNSIESLKALLDDLASLDEATYLCFTIDDWIRFILTMILSLRLSFPVPDCPQYDSSWARSKLQFDHFLCQMCLDPHTTPLKRLDVLSASRVVLAVVKDKYRRQLRAARKQAALSNQRVGCPMLDGSAATFLSLWEAGFDPSQADFAIPSTLDAMPGNVSSNMPVFHDLWATMTLNWASDDLGFG